MRVVFIAAECEPWAKTGGLGDVVDALARALGRIGDGPERTVDVYLPRYRTVALPEERVLGRGSVTIYDPGADGAATEVEVIDVAADGYRLRLVDHPPAFDRPAIYGEGGDYPDNAWRFNLLCLTALAAVDAEGGTDVLHIHDWHGGPVGLLRDALAPIVPWLDAAALVLTCHNLAYHGVVPRHRIRQLGPLPPGVADWNDVNLLYEGIRRAEMVNTVSVTFARQALTPEFGMGMQGLLESKGDQFVGILNGLDMSLWDPSTDEALAATFSADDPAGRVACRRDLLERTGLDPEDDGPVIGSVGRLDPQKGLDLVAAAAPDLLDRGFRLVVQGSGDPRIAAQVATLVAQRPDRVAFVERFDRAMARRIYAGADMFVMPSRFEPSGQSQMIAMRYGAPPVVRATGGLVDTVIDADADPERGVGFTFDPATPDALVAALERAATARLDQVRWTAIRRRGMAIDWSWESGPAPAYVAIYRRALALRRGL